MPRSGGRDVPTTLTVSDVARSLRVSRDRVRTLIASAKLTASNLGSRAKPVWRIELAELEAFLQRTKGRAPEPRGSRQADVAVPGSRNRREWI